MQNSENIHDYIYFKNSIDTNLFLRHKCKDFEFVSSNILLVPYFLKYIGSKPYVVTVHDMIPEQYNVS